MASGSFDLTHVVFEGRPAARPHRRSPALPRVAALRQPPHAPRRPSDDIPADDFPLWVLEQAGLDGRIYRGSALNRRVSACLRALKVPDTGAASALLASRPELVQYAVSILLIGVTEFFRDGAVFTEVRDQVVPALATRTPPVRCWSAGCASGQELYSLAFLLADAGLLEHSVLLGTDCQPGAIARAREGIFPAAAVASLPTAFVSRFFDLAHGSFRVAAPLRACTTWATSSLPGGVPEGAWDVILCRNVSIYMTAESAALTWLHLSAALRPGGFLVVGRAERPPSEAGLHQLSRSIYRKGIHHHERA